MTLSTGKRPFKPRISRGEMIACIVCGRQTYRYPGDINRKFCGRSCRNKFIATARVKDGSARCSRCRQWKPVDEFAKGSGNRPHSYCKPCHAEWFCDRRGTPPEKRRPYRDAESIKKTDDEKRKTKREANQRAHSARRAGGSMPGRAQIQSLYESQSGLCAYCRIELDGKYHIDHKLPIARGGGNGIENLHLTCAKCNTTKGTMDHEEFLGSKKFLIRKGF